MNEDLETMLREHYRRAAENIQPDADLIGSCRNVPRRTRPTRVRAVPTAWPTWVAAAAAAAIALATWAMLRPGPPPHRDVPIAPPAVTTPVPSPRPSPLPSRLDRVPRPARSTRLSASNRPPAHRPISPATPLRTTSSASPTPRTAP